MEEKIVPKFSFMKLMIIITLLKEKRNVFYTHRQEANSNTSTILYLDRFLKYYSIAH